MSKSRAFFEFQQARQVKINTMSLGKDYSHGGKRQMDTQAAPECILLSARATTKCKHNFFIHTLFLSAASSDKHTEACVLKIVARKRGSARELFLGFEGTASFNSSFRPRERAGVCDYIVSFDTFSHE